MSFNPNDITINLGNYEEYFILYMDNELSEDQRKMVDAFLIAHPDLQSELEILMGTKLPAEEFPFNKEILLADSMKLNAVDEDLLLYIDNELPGEKKKIVELELATNPIYQQQHLQLLQTKLDASEWISYPNKKELYRRTERVLVFKPWMRIAAAVVVMAAIGILYFTGNDAAPAAPRMTAEGKKPDQLNTESIQNQIKVAEEPSQQVAMAENSTAQQNPASQAGKENTGSNSEVNYAVQKITDVIDNTTTEDVVNTPPLVRSTTIALNSKVEATTASFDPSKIINKSDVTSALSQRNTTINATAPTVPDDVANNSEHKGSFKSFLRKATRLIERKTGIDPTSGEDEELLIGAVAVKLK